tara:strand:+ start:17 stop:1015 length:999 start_codon:yes stop_codon:yes gene_type:complete
MATITAYPPTTPALEDLVIIADISKEGNPTRTSTVRDIVNLISFEPIPGEGTVTSVAQTHAGNAFIVTGSPITAQGTLAITLIGDSSEYINGAGDLEAFPTASFGSLTTNGTSGASTLVGGVLNVPNYTPGGGGVTSIIAGTNVTVSPVGGTGAVTINAAGGGGGGGTVTRVGAIDGTFISSVSADITAAGDLTYDLSATGTPNGGTFLRGDNSWASVPNVITYNSFTAIVDWTAATSTFTVTQLFNNTGKTFAFTAPFVQNDYFITPSTNFADVDKVWLSFTGANYNDNRTYFPAASVNASEVIFFIQESDTGNSIATDWSQLFVEIRIYP